MSTEVKIAGVPDIVVFLGAGASCPLGYPTTKEFIAHLQESLKRNGKNEEANFLHYILTNISDIHDVEQVLELLETLEEDWSKLPSRKFYEKFTTHIRLGSDYDLPLVLKWLKSLREEIEKEVFEAYHWKPEIRTKARDMHQALLNYITGLLKDPKDVLIFTTNYDRVIEEVGNILLEYEVVDGFRVIKGGKNIWDPTVFQRTSNEKTTLIKLFKVHGSLNWRETTENSVEKVFTEERTLGNPTHKRNVVIYPTLTHKQNHTVQYLNTLYELFKTIMGRIRCCVVIGYSFRDQDINEVFLDFIGRKGTILIAVSPSAEINVRKNLLKEEVAEGEKIGEASERNSLEKGNIWMINRKFGEGQTYEEIGKYLDRLAPRAV